MLMNYLQRTLNWEIYICMKDHSLNTYLILAWFDIRVKRYSKGHQKNPEIIVIKGEAPLQYPEFY